MSDQVYSMRVAAKPWTVALRLSLAVHVLSAVACLSAELFAIPPTDADDVVTKIVTAWETHQKSIQSFQYHCDFEWMQYVELKPVDDTKIFPSPPGKNARLAPVVSRSELMFCMDRGKFAFKKTGDVWHEQKKMKVPTDWQACFDGVDAKTLLQGGIHAHGYVAPQGDLEKATISNSSHLIGLWLGYSPSTWLRTLGFSVEKMVVRSSEEVNDDGTPCIELMIPRAKQVGLLYVDPAQGYRPLKLIQQSAEGIIHVQHEVSYHDDAAGSVYRWISSRFDSDEVVKESHTGTTKTVSINEPLDEELFKLQFPIGTQITKEKAGTRKYYIQEAEGRRRKISGREYGKLPSGPAT